jgi:hypothetical protein
LESIELPECTQLKATFAYCGKLKNVSVPKLESTDLNAFYNCTSLESLEFPITFKRILRTNTFNGCSNLTKIVLPYNGVVSLANINSFTNTPFASGQGHIYVPANQVDNYKTATNWSTYARVITSMEEMDNE